MGIKRYFKNRRIEKQKSEAMERFASAAPGSSDWLIGSELKFGGYVTNVPRNKVSSDDPRSKESIAQGGMTGGDRMIHHGYADKYSAHLLPFVGQRDRKLTLAEFGILKGSGLAIWCELFPDARVLGFDIDLGHTRNNMDNLKQLGAFTKNQPELHEFDQFKDNTALLGDILQGDKLDIVIDDGFHSNETIMNTLKSTMPYMADNFVYFVEDNKEVHHEIRAAYPELTVHSHAELTILVKGQPGKS